MGYTTDFISGIGIRVHKPKDYEDSSYEYVNEVLWDIFYPAYDIDQIGAEQMYSPDNEIYIGIKDVDMSDLDDLTAKHKSLIEIAKNSSIITDSKLAYYSGEHIM